MKKVKFSYKFPSIISVFLLAIIGCGSSNNRASFKTNLANTDTINSGMKDFYLDYFPIGASIAPRSLNDQESRLIKKEFNSVTLEYLLQLKHVYKEPGYYDFEAADKLIDFAKDNNLKVRGHSLCWHDQVPEWYIKDKSGNILNREQLLARHKNHVETMVNRYKNTIYAWDVVNEAISNEPKEYIEKSPFQQIIGDDYIAKMFEYANQSDPSAKLFYNDNNYINPKKRKKIIRLVNALKKSNIPIHGIGIQGHWSIYGPTEKELRETLDDITKLGLEIQITELDVSLHPKNNKEREKKALLLLKGNPNQEELQAKQYEMIFSVLREYKKYITGVTFWNVSDYYSWMDKPSIKHRPLLFDEDFKRKDVYFRVIDFK